jgi:hypothetical protein
MTERLKRRTHDEITRRWVHVRTPGHAEFGKPDFSTEHIQSLDMGAVLSRKRGAAWSERNDELRSYGSHFPLVQAIRDHGRKGSPVRLWLLNGDTWGGSGGWGKSTSTQQFEVRDLCEASGIPTIILPFSAIDAAGIDHSTIRILAIDADEWHTVEFRSSEFPDDAEWIPTHEAIPGTGHYTTHPETGEFWASAEYETWESIPESIRAYFNSDGTVRDEFRERVQYGQAFGRRYRKWDTRPARDYATGPIEFPNDNGWRARTTYYVPPVYRHTGRNLQGRHGEYTVNADGTYSQTRSVHQLGQSVFRAAYRGSNGKRYWANFLSGVDSTPTGSGYFLVQLPKRADVSSVASAIESLKPETVRVAEGMGIEVKRQGDLFAIPTEYSIRDLRKMGADIRQSAKASEQRRDAIKREWEDRFTTALMALEMPTHMWEYRQHPDNVQWRNFTRMHAHYSELARKAIREFDSTHAIHTKREVYGTRHYGTDIAILPSGVTLARGTLRHSGGDHSMLRMGKVWHIIVRNTVPLAR